jgi:hypothetical protein
MKKIILLYLASFIWADGTDTKKPYEATWLKILKADDSYVVPNYPSLWDDGETKSPWTYRVKGDSITLIVPSDEPMVFKDFDEIVKLSDSSYKFNPKDWNKRSGFRFDYIDKTNHIAKWIIYSYPDKIQDEFIFIDSLYNTFPLSEVEYIWEDDCDESC